jgi:uncharacterized protein
VVEQHSYLVGGEPFPTTYYLTCPAAVTAISRLEDTGGVARFEALVESDADAARSYQTGSETQRRLRRPGVRMADGGRSLRLGIGGTARPGAVKCLHAHAAFALVHQDYELGRLILADAEPVFPAVECCCR